MDKDKRREYNQKYYSLNKKRILEQKREYQKNNKESVNLRNRKSYHTNETFRLTCLARTAKRQRAWRLDKLYNITEEEYQDMIIKQNNKCAICGSSDWSGKFLPLIDHNHDTGKVRGLLCFKCNLSLGGFRDSVEILESAINYLKKYDEQSAN